MTAGGFSAFLPAFRKSVLIFDYGFGPPNSVARPVASVFPSKIENQKRFFTTCYSLPAATARHSDTIYSCSRELLFRSPIPTLNMRKR